MAFKERENLAGRGKFYPVFILDDGDMYSLRMSEEKLDLFQILVQSLFEGSVTLDKEPLNNFCSYRIEDKRKI